MICFMLSYLVSFLVLFGSLSKARGSVDVATSTLMKGEIRHLAPRYIECRLWKIDIALEDGTGFNEWKCNFHDQKLFKKFSGHRDKLVVGFDGGDMNDFFELNGAKSGRSILVLSDAAVYRDKIVFHFGQIVALKEFIPTSNRDPLYGASSESPRLKFPETSKMRLQVGVDTSKLRDDSPTVAETERTSRHQSRSIERDMNIRRLTRTLGKLKTLVVRVIANDAIPQKSALSISEDVFGDEYCLKSQYERCSYGKLQIEEYAGDILDVPTVYNAPGVIEIDININAKDNRRSNLEESAKAALAAKFNIDIENIEQKFDLVLFCMPPGTGNWIAYAYLDRWDSYYNDDWCNSLSAQMHEVGHNLNLQHSGEYTGSATNQDYGDKSGMMSFSYRNDDFPKMCFNPAKNWQLKWYPDKQIDVDLRLLTNDPTSYILNGIVDYENTTTDANVIIKVGNYYIGYNKASGFNSETQEAQNQVTVHEKLGPADSPARSKRVENLIIGQMYTIPVTDFLQVQVKYVQNENNKDAIIELTNLGEILNCEGEFDAEITVNVITDTYPGETSWSILDYQGLSVSDRPKYTFGGEFIDTVSKLCRGLPYYFIIYDTYGDGICCNSGNGSYAGKYKGDVIFSGGTFRSEKLEPFTLPLPPSMIPSAFPSLSPSDVPSLSSLMIHSGVPSLSPSYGPSATISAIPSASPSISPSDVPSVSSSMIPSSAPSLIPSYGPSTTLSAIPSASPSMSPSYVPSVSSSLIPSYGPSTTLPAIHSASPSISRSDVPSMLPSTMPSVFQSTNPSSLPSACEDSENFKMGSKTKTCEKFLKPFTFSQKKVKRKCKKRVSENYVYDFCKKTCGEIAGVGPCR